MKADWFPLIAILIGFVLAAVWIKIGLRRWQILHEEEHVLPPEFFMLGGPLCYVNWYGAKCAVASRMYWVLVQILELILKICERRH